MPRQLLCVVLVGAGLFSSPPAISAEPPLEKPAADKPSAAELVQGIIDAENTIQDVRSLYLRFEGKWTRTPEAIAAARAELKKQSPEREIDEKRNSNLWPEMTEELELAFDKNRVRRFAHWHKAHRGLQVFDGKQTISHMHYFTNGQEQYVLSSEPDDMLQELFISLSWLRVGAPKFWFSHRNIGRADRERINGYPKDFVLVGQEEVRGRLCYVLENRRSHRRLYVGVDDRRLHQLTFYSYPQTVDTSKPYAKAARQTFSNSGERAQWFKGLSPAEKFAFHERFGWEMFPLMRPSAVHFLEDYGEVAPGLWMPATQGYSILGYEDGKPEVSRERRLVEARVNEPLDDALFQVEMKDGVQVADLTHDPPLFYKHQADRTPEEFQAIVDQAKQQNDAWQKQNAARDVLIGKPAPPLPKSTWLNGSELDWSALKGKVVLLDFWATWCGPCRNDLPQVEELHRQREDLGIVAIGIHATGAEAKDVADFAEEQELTYPIVIDDPAEARPSFGNLFTQLAIQGIPYSFVIDRNGNIAAHGSLHETLPKARELASHAAEKEKGEE